MLIKIIHSDMIAAIMKILSGIPLIALCSHIYCANAAGKNVFSSDKKGTADDSHLSILTNPFRYDGYYFDTESGMNYCMSRFYSTDMMSFITRDTYDVPDRYSYCSNDPVMRTDLSGHIDGGFLKIFTISENRYIGFETNCYEHKQKTSGENLQMTEINKKKTALSTDSQSPSHRESSVQHAAPAYQDEEAASDRDSDDESVPPEGSDSVKMVYLMHSDVGQGLWMKKELNKRTKIADEYVTSTASGHPPGSTATEFLLGSVHIRLYDRPYNSIIYMSVNDLSDDFEILLSELKQSGWRAVSPQHNEHGQVCWQPVDNDNDSSQKSSCCIQ